MEGKLLPSPTRLLCLKGSLTMRCSLWCGTTCRAPGELGRAVHSRAALLTSLLGKLRLEGWRYCFSWEGFRSCCTPIPVRGHRERVAWGWSLYPGAEGKSRRKGTPRVVIE